MKGASHKRLRLRYPTPVRLIGCIPPGSDHVAMRHSRSGGRNRRVTQHTTSGEVLCLRRGAVESGSGSSCRRFGCSCCARATRPLGLGLCQSFARPFNKQLPPLPPATHPHPPPPPRLLSAIPFAIVFLSRPRHHTHACRPGRIACWPLPVARVTQSTEPRLSAACCNRHYTPPQRRAALHR